MTAPPAAVGVFGGSFDPVHFGHLRIAEEFRQAFALDEVRFIPTGQPPHRQNDLQPATHRLAMLERAIAGHPAFRIDRRELEREGLCYTIDTLRALRHELPPDTALVWLIGADSLLTLDRWRDWPALLDLATLAVAVRPGFDLDTGLDAANPALAAAVRPRLRAANPSAFQTLSDRITPERGTIVALTTTPLAISATAIRALLRQRRSARYLAPDAVLDYAERHLLYQTPASHS